MIDGVDDGGGWRVGGQEERKRERAIEDYPPPLLRLGATGAGASAREVSVRVAGAMRPM